jgi:hypothetical protein
MQKGVTPEAMRLRRCTVEHPFATIKYRIFGHPCILMRPLTGLRAEIDIATMAYNLKRITNVFRAAKLTKALFHPGIRRPHFCESRTVSSISYIVNCFLTAC